MRFTLLVCASLFACGGGAAKSADEPSAPAENAAPAAAAVDESAPAAEPKVSEEPAARDVVDQAVAMFESVATVVTSAGDCDQMATDLNAWADTNAAELKRVNDELNESGRVQEVQERMQDKAELVQKLQESVMACKDNAAVMEAFMKVQGG